MAYETGWTPIVELQSGQVVADKHDDAYGNTDIALTDIEARLAALESQATKLYVTDKAVDVLNITNTFSTLCSVDYSLLLGDIAEFKYSVSFIFDVGNTANSAIFRFSINDGASWTEHHLEVKKENLSEPQTYFFPETMTVNTSSTFLFEVRKENATDTLDILYADIIVDQKN